MTNTQTAEKKTDFHPEIEAIFDAAQEAPVLVDLGESETAVLSALLFERAKQAAATLDIELKFSHVDRGDKPDVVIVPFSQLTELLELLDLALETSAA